MTIDDYLKKLEETLLRIQELEIQNEYLSKQKEHLEKENEDLKKRLLSTRIQIHHPQREKFKQLIKPRLKTPLFAKNVVLQMDIKEQPDQQKNLMK